MAAKIKYPPMNASFKKRWVKALLSGKYKQGQGYLRQYNPETDELRFCCLGVLRDIITPSSRATTPMMSKFHTKQCGLSSDAQETLADLNDDGWSFKRIAAWIEKNL